MPTPLEVLTIRVATPVKKRLQKQAEDLGRTLAEHLRESLSGIAHGAAPPPTPQADAFLVGALEAIAKELVDNRANERATSTLVLNQLDQITSALAASIEAILKLHASDETARFTRDQIRDFVNRVFQRRS